MSHCCDGKHHSNHASKKTNELELIRKKRDETSLFRKLASVLHSKQENNLGQINSNE